MFRSRSVCRSVAVCASVGAAAALTWLPAGPASAITPVAVYLVQGSSTADSACTVTSGSSFASNPPKNLQSGRAKGGINLLTTWTNGSNSSDVTTVSGHYGGNTHLVRKNGAFRSASLSGSGQLTISRSLGNASQCHASGQLLNAVEFITKQPTGWYYVTRSTIKNSLTETVVARGTSLISPVLFEAYQGGKNTVTQRAFVKRGQYVTALVAGIEGGDFPILNTRGGAPVSRASNVNSMSAFFRDAGSALGGTSGSGGQFVSFPASVSCSHHKATLTWKSGASKVAAGSFFVNGKKKASVSNPKPGRSVVLKNLSSTADNKITAKLSLKGGGSSSASRTYVPCKG